MAGAQVETSTSSEGTIIIVSRSQNEILVAADSRRTNYKGEIPHDDECKIAALDSKFFCAFAGRRRLILNIARKDGSDRFQMSWNSDIEAREAFYRVSKNRPEDEFVKKVATNWATTTADRFNKLEADPVKKASAPNILFVGLERDGNISAYEGKVFYSQHFSPGVYPIPITPLLNPAIAGHGGDLVAEFLHHETARSKGEFSHWISQIPTNASQQQMTGSMIIQLINWAVAYDQSGKIGGPAQCIELKRGGTVKWISQCQRRQNK
jgi:hypothetical protein